MFSLALRSLGAVKSRLEQLLMHVVTTRRERDCEATLSESKRCLVASILLDRNHSHALRVDVRTEPPKEINPNVTSFNVYRNRVPYRRLT